MAKKQKQNQQAEAAVVKQIQPVSGSAAEVVNGDSDAADFGVKEETQDAIVRSQQEVVEINKMRSDRNAVGKEKRMALITGVQPEKTVSTIAPAILDGILGKHIAHAVEEVTIKAKTSPTKKDESRPFDAFYALDAEGMMILCNGKIEPATPAPSDGKDDRTDEQKASGACDHFNYGRLLNVRQIERGRLETSIEGPEKSIAKLVKSLMDGGLHENENEAREEVITRLKKKGQLAPDYVWSGAAAATTT